MRLHLSFPPRWIHKVAPGNQRAAILPGADPKLPELVITYGPLVVRPDEPRPWMEKTSREAPARTRVTIGRTLERRSSAGWPLHLVEAEVFGPDDKPIEVRLCAFYTFMEHAAVAIVRAESRARLEAHGKDVLAILDSGRPDWRAEPACLAEAWDLEGGRPARRDGVAVAGPVAGDAATSEPSPPATAAEHVAHGRLLLARRRQVEALDAFRAALALAPPAPVLDAARRGAGVVLGALGRHAEALAEWERLLADSPDDVDTLYNVAQARYLLKEHEAALAGFRRAFELAPRDLLILRKVAQCLYALDRHDEGAAVRRQFRAAWEATTDPRVRLLTEYVFDQFDGDGCRIHALEILRDPVHHTLLAFRAVDDRDRALDTAVTVETSEIARRAGTPFVLGLQVGARYRVVDTLAELPPHPALRSLVRSLLGEGIRGDGVG